MELCTYVMPGLGGKALSESHMMETAKMIRKIEPDHIWFRTCFVLEDTPLAAEYLKGNFEPLSEEETVLELKAFLNQIKGINTRIISDHRINLLFELEGSLNADYETMENIVDRFLNLSDEEKRLFIAGRRLRIIKKLDELNDRQKREEIISRFDDYQVKIPVSQDILF
jgi:histone acetyltransferase (RNA polymerase elongator complex component)